MKDLRCKKCNKLLCRYRDCGELEIKCPRCGSVNSLTNGIHIVRPKTAKKEERAVITVRSDSNVG
ncbi:MAG: Com family DNA-binding transcriptional regulator [Syntrophomonadaceae bacterium]|jgi:phage FluMu protein Com|nr:Com family DNA-binding transcriptional regulator [Syntrophomonadaceae bacterium]